MAATQFSVRPASGFITALSKSVDMNLLMAVTRPVPIQEFTSQHPDATHPSFSNKPFPFSMVLIRGVGSRFQSVNLPRLKSITYLSREWASDTPPTSTMFWKIIVITSLMSSWKFWLRGVSACQTSSTDVHLGPLSSTVWYLSVTWTFSTSRHQRREQARRITLSRMSTNRPIRAAMPSSATRMYSGGPMGST